MLILPLLLIAAGDSFYFFARRYVTPFPPRLPVLDSSKTRLLSPCRVADMKAIAGYARRRGGASAILRVSAP